MENKKNKSAVDDFNDNRSGHGYLFYNCKESGELGVNAHRDGPASGIPYDIRNRGCLYFFQSNH